MRYTGPIPQMTAKQAAEAFIYGYLQSENRGRLIEWWNEDQRRKC